MGIDLIGLAIIAAAAARLWHLAATDKLSRPLRERLPDTIATWFACPRCAGFWCAIAAAAAWTYSRDTALETPVTIIMTALAVNWAYFASRETISEAFGLAYDRHEASQADRRRAIETRGWHA